jgi:16S rRNA (uracil1498-N3)-methyltransferase
LHISRRTADVVIESTASPVTESPLETVLLQGISKGDRMDYSIQKAVELGVTRIQPLFTERCDVKLSGDKLDKKRRQWQDIAINACEQSNRNVVPEIAQPETYQAWLKAANAPSGLVLSPTAEHSLTTLNPSLAESPIHLLIGPEGGLTDDEVDLAVAAGLTAIQLGPRILRTETAAPVILAALQTLWGDFNTPMTAS